MATLWCDRERDIKQLGRIETGDVSEQEVEFDYKGQTYRCRRVVVDLDKPTRNGEKQVVVLSNLPAEGEQIVSGITIANLYRKRWSIETLFQIVTENFEGEISTLAYPKAALFSFSMALCAYNVLATVRAAIGSIPGVAEMATKLSDYYLADEIAGTYRGMMVALPPEEWQGFATLSGPQMAEFLQSCAAQVNLIYGY